MLARCYRKRVRDRSAVVRHDEMHVKDGLLRRLVKTWKCATGICCLELGHGHEALLVVHHITALVEPAHRVSQYSGKYKSQLCLACRQLFRKMECRGLCMFVIRDGIGRQFFFPDSDRSREDLKILAVKSDLFCRLCEFDGDRLCSFEHMRLKVRLERYLITDRRDEF